MEYLKVGTIVKTFGLKGELKVYSSSDFAAKRYAKGNKVFLFNPKDKSYLEMEVSKYRNDKGMDYVTFKGFEDINKVEQYVGYEIHVIKDNKDLPEGSYFLDDLKKCNVVDEKGILLGKVKDIEQYASYYSLRVARNDIVKDFLVPFVKAFIINVDLDNKTITINNMKGLID